MQATNSTEIRKIINEIIISAAGTKVKLKQNVAITYVIF